MNFFVRRILKDMQKTLLNSEFNKDGPIAPIKKGNKAASTKKTDKIISIKKKK